jgi:hypothetical protein
MKLCPVELRRPLRELTENQTIPEYAIRGIFNCDPIVMSELSDIASEDKKLLITRVAQLRALEEEAEKQTEGLMLFSGNRFPTRARQAAMLFVAAQIKFGFISPKFVTWKRIDFGADREFAKLEAFRSQCMIVDAVYPNSSFNSIEKIRTLVYKFDPALMIILGAGACPQILAHNVLHVDAGRLLRFQ